MFGITADYDAASGAAAAGQRYRTAARLALSDDSALLLTAIGVSVHPAHFSMPRGGLSGADRPERVTDAISVGATP